MSDLVEELAHWIHREFCRGRGRAWLAEGRELRVWSQMDEQHREDYRHVARQLLDNPPAVLFMNMFPEKPVLVRDQP